MNSIRRIQSGNSLVGRRTLTRWAAGCLLLSLLALPLSAQETPKPSLPAGRFLFMVDTSLSMRSRADGMLRAVEGLLTSGLDGRLRPGDSIGIWTFNDEVYAGRFPLQTWTPATRSAASATVLEFLRQQRYEKKTDLGQALRKALALVRSSPTITLLLFTDGEQSVSGTPFDDAINAAFREARRAQARARMPFVTVLRAERGRIASHVVGLPPWPIEIPPLPVELKALEAGQPPRKSDSKETGVGTVASKPATSVPSKPPETKPPAQPTEQSKAETAPAPLQSVVTPSAVAAKPPAAKPAEKPLVAVTKPVIPLTSEAPPAKPQIATNPVKPPAPAAPPANATPEPKPVRSTEVSKALEVMTPPAVVIEPAKPAATDVRPVTAAPEPSKPVEVKAAPPVVPAPVETKLNAAEPLTQPEPARSVEPPPSKPAPVEAKTTTATEATPAPVASPATVRPQQDSKPAAPLPTPATLRDRVQSTSVVPPPAVEAEPKPAASVALRDNAAAIQTALVATPQPFLSGQRLLIVGLLLLGVAGVLFCLIVRRSRAAGAPGSLITQSFDRDKKQP